MACVPVAVIPSLACCASVGDGMIKLSGYWTGYTSVMDATNRGVRYLSSTIRDTLFAYGAGPGGTRTTVSSRAKWPAVPNTDNTVIIPTVFSEGWAATVSALGGFSLSGLPSPDNVITHAYSKQNFFGGPFPGFICGYREKTLSAPWLLTEARDELLAGLAGLTDFPTSTHTPPQVGANAYAFRLSVAASLGTEFGYRGSRILFGEESSLTFSLFFDKESVITVDKTLLRSGGSFCDWESDVDDRAGAGPAGTNPIGTAACAAPQSFPPGTVILYQQPPPNQLGYGRYRRLLLSGELLAGLNPNTRPACCGNPFA